MERMERIAADKLGANENESRLLWKDSPVDSISDAEETEGYPFKKMADYSQH